MNKPEDDALARVVPALPAPPPARRPAALPPARLGGNRDWVIFVECRADVVVLYPSRRPFPLETVAQNPGINPLVRTVQQMIARRQGLVRPGEPPFRPQVRFLVRPDALRTFHLAYPALDSLGIPMWRQNLEPEDDVATITAGS